MENNWHFVETPIVDFLSYLQEKLFVGIEKYQHVRKSSSKKFYFPREMLYFIAIRM